MGKFVKVKPGRENTGGFLSKNGVRFTSCVVVDAPGECWRNVES